MFLVGVDGKQKIKRVFSSVRGLRLLSVVVTEQEIDPLPADRWRRYLEEELRPALLDNRSHIVVVGEEVTVLA